MTTPEDTNIQVPDSDEQEVAYYIIDPSRARELNRSLAAALLSRRCPSCRAKLEAQPGLPSEEEQIREIATCCAHEEGFIRPEMSVQEIVFRTILAEGNRPVDLERLHYLVTEGWYSPANPRSITADNLKQVLDRDVYYGFRKVSQTSAK